MAHIGKHKKVLCFMRGVSNKRCLLTISIDYPIKVFTLNIGTHYFLTIFILKSEQILLLEKGDVRK